MALDMFPTDARSMNEQWGTLLDEDVEKTNITVTRHDLPEFWRKVQQCLPMLPGSISPDEGELKPRTLEELCPDIDCGDIGKELTKSSLIVNLVEVADESNTWNIILGVPWLSQKLVLIVRGCVPEIPRHHLVLSFSVAAYVSPPENEEAEPFGVVSGSWTGGSKYFITNINLDDFLRPLYVFYHKDRSLFEVEYRLRLDRKIFALPNFSGFQEVFEIPELALLIASYLNLRDLKSLQNTCKSFRNLFHDQATQRLSSLLSKVFIPRGTQTLSSLLASFSELIASTGSVVGGSTALAVLCPGDWKPGDLDIVVGEDEWPVIHQFLVDVGHFVWETDEEKAPPRYPQHNFSHHYYRNSNPEGLGIDVCVTSEHRRGWDPRIVPLRPVDFILSYHSTVVMNFWDGDHLLCLWPELTFNNILLRNKTTFATASRTQLAFVKYKTRGWTDQYAPNSFGTSLSSAPELNGEPDRQIQDVYGIPEGSGLRVGDIPQPWWYELLTFDPEDDLDNSEEDPESEEEDSDEVE